MEPAPALERANTALLDLLTSLPSEAWEKVAPTEGWPVRATARHIGDGYRIHRRWLELLLRGVAVPGTPTELDEENARTAMESAGMPPERIIAEIDSEGRDLAIYLGALDLDRAGDRAVCHGPLGGEPVSVREMVEIALWHVEHHSDSIRAAVG
jgi:hypothetical protein